MLENEIYEKVKTGTTTVGVVCRGAVVLAAERKATMGYLVASHKARKILQIDEHLAMTIAGIVGDAQALGRYIRAELKLYSLQEERRINVKAAATLIANILYSRRFYPYIVQLIVAGYDREPRLFTLSPDGSVMEESFFSTGSGSPMALGVLENDFKEDMEPEAAKRIVARAVKAAISRDIASGGSGIDMVVLDSRGFHEVPEEEVKRLAG